MISLKEQMATSNVGDTLMWFRQDLRLADNQALTAACDWARAQGTALRAIYIATPIQWECHDVAPIQLDFIERHINLLAKGSWMFRYSV